jgi:hypothetical protein
MAAMGGQEREKLKKGEGSLVREAGGGAGGGGGAGRTFRPAWCSQPGLTQWEHHTWLNVCANGCYRTSM